MFDFKSLFFKKEPGSQEVSVAPKIVKQKNWYDEKYDKAITQRNILLILSIFFLILSSLAVISVAIIVSSKEYDPFVIQIDESTGVAKVVNPVLDKVIDANDSLARYFVREYVNARETYNPVDFDTRARQIIRLFSSGSIYRNYIGYITNKANDPTLTYGREGNTTYMVVKSWTKLADKKIMVRFSVNETVGQKNIFNKLAVLDFDYVALELTDAEREINPVGFQVQGYRVDDDNS